MLTIETRNDDGTYRLSDGSVWKVEDPRIYPLSWGPGLGVTLLEKRGQHYMQDEGTWGLEVRVARLA